MNLILAIDYDGTIAYEGTLILKPNAKEVINRLHAEGFYIIIWTCRSDKLLKEAVEFLNSEGVSFHKVNEQHPHLIAKYNNNTRKIAADIYVDNQHVGSVPDDWEELYQLIKAHASEIHSKQTYHLKD